MEILFIILAFVGVGVAVQAFRRRGHSSVTQRSDSVSDGGFAFFDGESHAHDSGGHDGDCGVGGD